MGQSIDGVLVEWGERLFYPGNRIVKPRSTPRLDTQLRRQAAVIRGRIQAIVPGYYTRLGAGIRHAAQRLRGPGE